MPSGPNRGRRSGRGGQRGVGDRRDGDRRGGGRDSGTKRVPQGNSGSRGGGQQKRDGQGREDKVYRVDGVVLNNPDAVKVREIKYS